jgi:formylglycine-generating enzyme required for sulfatase activity/serine/threonine protein kinase
VKTTIKTCTQCNAVYDDASQHVCPDQQAPPIRARLLRPYSGMLLDKKYRLISKLGEGGMGSVYRAQRLFMNDLVAIKFMRPEVMADSDIRQRFYQEAKVAARMKHANVVTVYDCGETNDGLVYLVMELLEGESLGEMIHRHGPLELNQVLDIGIQICEALGCMLEHNVIHRDLKPDNIMLVPDGRDGFIAKVVDFGVAKVLEADAHLTRVQSRIGSPVYSSPEQYLGKPVDHRTDLYGLGVIFYECLTGHVPFEALTQDELLTAILHKMPQRLDKKITGFTSMMADLVHWLLAKDPNDRPRDAMEVAKCLETLRDSKKTLQIFQEGEGEEAPAYNGRRPGLVYARDAMTPESARVRSTPARQPASGGRIANAAGRGPAAATDPVFRPRPIRKRIKKKLKRIARPVMLAATLGVAGVIAWGQLVDPGVYTKLAEAVTPLLPWSLPAAPANTNAGTKVAAAEKVMSSAPAAMQKDPARSAAPTDSSAVAAPPSSPLAGNTSGRTLNSTGTESALSMRLDNTTPGLALQNSAWSRSLLEDNAAGALKSLVRPAASRAGSRIEQKAPALANMVLVQETMFERGDVSGEGGANERPAHWVRLGEFWIGKHEVTNRDYFAFVEATGGHPPEWRDPNSKYHFQFGSDNFYKKLGAALSDPQYPVVGVSWYDAEAYCEWKSQQTGMKFRLPTESEWELAARAADTRSTYSWGSSAPQIAKGGNVADESLKAVYADLRMIWRAYDDNFVYTAPVGRFGANVYGLYDMTGNVWEWCNDWYSETEYQRKDSDNPTGPVAGKEKAIRGGSWSDTPEKLRVTFRRGMPPAFRSNNLGFRVVAVEPSAMAKKEALGR